MNSSQITPHQIEKGDNLYLLSQHYHTTVPEILALNPCIDPYNLQIGATIAIPSVPQNAPPTPAPRLDPNKQMALSNRMRLRWSQHVYWMRMELISIVAHLQDQTATTARLMQNPRDIANIFEAFYNHEIANMIAGLLAEHLQIACELMNAIRDHQMEKSIELDRQWMLNAERMVNIFCSINPYYDRAEIYGMIRSYMDLIKKEIGARVAGNYPADIEAFGEVEAESMMMADTFSAGLIQQFPQSFAV